MTAEDAERMLEKVAEELGEHFDAVQIMATWSEEGICRCSKRGCGNWYARQGMAHEFIGQNQAQLQAWEITRATGDNEE